MNLENVRAFIEREFPSLQLVIDQVGNRSSTLRLPVNTSLLRPGGTVSGPAQMMLADVGIYVAILGEMGEFAVQTVTSNMNLSFLSRPRADVDLLARCKLIRLGKRLATGEAFLYSAGDEEPVAHVVATYSIPPRT
ncbi:PaaI family thioesterase [Thiolinea disciformis]|uniref:PaaI family thioesterase n=1 Tax=Thiolinea disciformis TaxID=125614 RepID=UPI00036CD2AE|nr:PaaI family thioesterase [Thiolinea disciformis]